MEDIAAGRAAEKLLAQHKAKERFKTLGPPEGPATIADAYDIQEKYIALLQREHGDAVGYKVGLTSAAMQAFCRIDHPIAGVVLASRVFESGANIRRSDFGRLGLEFEIAVRIRSDVPVTGVPWTTKTIAPHIDGVCAAIELVDDRGADYPPSMFFRWSRTIRGMPASCCRNLPRHGLIWRACRAVPRRTASRSAKATAATSSATPSIQSRGSPRSWPQGAWV